MYVYIYIYIYTQYKSSPKQTYNKFYGLEAHPVAAGIVKYILGPGKFPHIESIKETANLHIQQTRKICKFQKP